MVEKKRRLLESEGVRFDKDGRVSADSFLSSLSNDPVIGTEIVSPKRKKTMPVNEAAIQGVTLELARERGAEKTF